MARGNFFLLFLLLAAGCVHADSGEPIQLTEENFDHVIKEFDVVMVNFYADWCRFCQQLRPIYEQAAQLLGDSVNARLARVDCEAHDTRALRERYSINKYPTLKIFRKGSVLKSEYRGQRSATAIEAFIRDLLKDPVQHVSGEHQLGEVVHAQRNHQAVTGRFSSPDLPTAALFTQVAESLRDECLFVADFETQAAGAAGSRIVFQSRTDLIPYEGQYTFEELHPWARDLCNPLVREITFENGEALTEEALPFLILFYDPANIAPVKEFTEVVKQRLAKERGQVNFITADGTLFTHPLTHMGKSRSDLPVLAFDTFKHMFLFKKFSDIHREGKIEQFVADLHSGKLHHDFHNPPPSQPEEEEGPSAAPPAAASLSSPSSSLPSPPSSSDTPLPPGAPGDKKEERREERREEKRELLQEKVQRVTEEKSAAVMVAKEIRAQNKAAVPTEDPEDDPSKPVAVRSILQKLKPSENRYSFRRNMEEL